jgi:hypothetical protein
MTPAAITVFAPDNGYFLPENGGRTVGGPTSTGADPSMLNQAIISRICTGRGSSFVDALREASRQELDEAKRRVEEYHDLDYPADAARRLDQIRNALSSGR